MNGVVLGFEIAAGILLFILVLFFFARRMLPALRARWYPRFHKDKPLPSDVRHYLFRRGVKQLSKVNLPPEKQSELAVMELTAALSPAAVRAADCCSNTCATSWTSWKKNYDGPRIEGGS